MPFFTKFHAKVRKKYDFTANLPFVLVVNFVKMAKKCHIAFLSFKTD